jgi:hypothetical protein
VGLADAAGSAQQAQVRKNLRFVVCLIAVLPCGRSFGAALAVTLSSNPVPVTA